MTGHWEQQVRGQTNVWLTPRHILEALGPFDLDPCAAVAQPWDSATRHLTVEDDGLAHEWDGYVWLNPPFGPDAKRWVERLADHGNGIALTAARVDTQWFSRQVWGRASLLLFLYGRVRFHHADGQPAASEMAAPVCLSAFGDYAAHRLATCGIRGSLVSSWEDTA